MSFKGRGEESRSVCGAQHATNCTEGSYAYGASTCPSQASSDPICLGLTQIQENTRTSHCWDSFIDKLSHEYFSKHYFFFPWAKTLTSNLKKDLKVVVIHGDLWPFPREFRAPGLSSHNSQEMQLKISHRLLIQPVGVGHAGESPVSPREEQDSYGRYSKSLPKPGDVSENAVVLSWHYQPRSMIYYSIPSCRHDQH